jgi:hypothetical protein
MLRLRLPFFYWFRFSKSVLSLVSPVKMLLLCSESAFAISGCGGASLPDARSASLLNGLAGLLGDPVEASLGALATYAGSGL